MIQIAHVSDIHFGSRFDVDTWQALRAAIINDVRPQVIVASGDFVDHPSPLHLLAAKCELVDMCKAVNARLVFVPGNHDVFESGIGAWQTRLDWWERIFNSDTAVAEDALAAEVGSRPALTMVYRDCPAIRPGIMHRIREWLGLGPADNFTRHIGAARPLTPIVVFDNLPILFARIDSNPTEPGLDLATGVVSDASLVHLREQLAAEMAPYLARIAVVHHHVLPIAYTGPSQSRLEATMVLRNAGTLLQILADNRFDLVLHGHWHKPQFSRIDINPDGHDDYPMAIAAAGSAAMTTANPRENCFNVITVADNGLIDVRAVYYGAAQAPDPNGHANDHVRAYPEPHAAATLRGYTRACERHGIFCDRREQFYEISENGDLRSEQKVAGFRVRNSYKGPLPYVQRPLSFTLPQHGRFVARTLTLDQASKSAGAQIKAVTAPAPSPGGPATSTHLHYSITLPNGGLQRNVGKADFSVSHASANSMTMTRWEARQRAECARRRGEEPPDEDEEWVGLRVGHPLGQMTLHVTFPESLERIQPEVRCLRHRAFPAYGINDLGDVSFLPAKDGLVPDMDFQREATSNLHYNASQRRWTLAIERPMVGYQYELRWKLPGEEADATLEGQTLAWQQELLKLAVPSAAIDAQRQNARKVFDILTQEMERSLAGGEKGEQWNVTLFVYAPNDLTLRPAIHGGPWPGDAMTFEVPLGGGIAGAAFLQSRMIPWSKKVAGPSLIEPIPYPPQGGVPTVDLNNMLAIPVYHPSLQDEARPPPWGTLGVLSFGTTSFASPITKLHGSGTEVDRMRQELRALAQTHVSALVDVLYGGHDG